MALLNPSMQQAVAARLRFYRDLGLYDFYRRPVDPALLAVHTESEESAASVSPTNLGAPSYSPPLADRVGNDEPSTAVSGFPPNVGWGRHEPDLDRPAALRAIQEDIGDCTRCALHAGRHTIVFGHGSPNARIMFVGEGPGADEDAQGLPFVGKAGQLLNNMIVAMGLKREEVYIANVVMCRPPDNRNPEPEEANTCSPFLFQQIEVVQPEVLVALGATAATYLLGQRQPLAGLRGRVHTWRGSKLIVTYHPAFLLRDPRMKKDAWADLQIAMAELGLKPKGRE